MSRIGVAVLLGPPGSGKGTQARNLGLKHPGWVHISTGDLFRAEIASGSPLGLSVKDVLATGKLVSDDVTCEVFGSQVNKIVATGKAKVLLLDGFPRTSSQTDFLLKFIASNVHLGPLVFIEFKIAENTVVSRVADRLVNPRTGRVYHRMMNPPKKPGFCDEDGQSLIQRDDDKPETIRNRFRLYESQLGGIRGAAGSKVSLSNINAEGTPDEVFARLEVAVEKAFKEEAA